MSGASNTTFASGSTQLSSPTQRKQLFVYCAGPFTKPIPTHTTNRAVLIGKSVVELGHIPFVPHLYLLWDTVSPESYDYWMNLCFAWISKCDVLYRAPGESSGADQEVALARKLNIPVIYDLQELIKM